MNNDLRPINTISNFKRFCMTIGELPTSYLETMTYYEMLVWFTEYMKNTIIPTINNNGLAVQELQDKYIELESYVDDYFTNLDVQQEINNKLDAMAESGQLTDIIAQYLGLAGVLSFNTIADMKQATNLVNGSTCQTLGFHTVGDKGNAFYKIKNITNEDIIDEMTIIALNNPSLIAELVIEDEMNIKQFGAKCDNLTDDSLNAEKMLIKCNYINLGNNNCIIKNLNLPNNAILKNGKITSLLSGVLFTGENLDSLLIENIEFKATFHKDNPSNDNCLINLYNSKNIIIRNIKINDCRHGINFVNCENIIVHDNEITGTSRFGFNFGTNNYIFGYVKNVQFYNNVMHDNPYIPLKFTGYIENIDVFNNTGFNNLDSEETACFSFKNVKIHDNVFSNDTNRNIGFKQLDYTEYPLPEDAPETLYSEDLEIYNNSCKNGNHNGINIQLYYNHNTDGIRIHDNTVDSIGTDNYIGIRIGVFNSSIRNACQIYNNTINLHNKGVQGIVLFNANNVNVYNNNVYECIESCIKIIYHEETDLLYNVKVNNIYIFNNVLQSLLTNSSRCIFFNASNNNIDDNITNVTIIKNNFNVNANANQIQDKPSTALISQNYDGVNLYDTAPSRRSANYTIYYAKDPLVAGCIGWIATGGITTPTYKQYIPIS